MRRIRVLIVDDSALVRDVLTQGLSQDPELEVVATASNPYMARDRIVELKPDVLTLDVEMPRMNGVEFLQRLMAQYPIPVVMVSALTQRGAAITLAALEAGAVDFVGKPSTNIARGLGDMLRELRQKIKIAAGANVQQWKQRLALHGAQVHAGSRRLGKAAAGWVIAIGASTGGTEAIRRILCTLPEDMPPILIVQHMPAGFTKHFADSVNQRSRLEVIEARSGDLALPGRVLIAPGGKHMLLKRRGAMYTVECLNGEPVNGHRPSVDTLFYSVAETAGRQAIGVVLTGMGHDGAAGLLVMRQHGALTLAQNEASSVVYGMPRAAYECGAAQQVVALESVPEHLLDLLQGGSQHANH